MSKPPLPFSAVTEKRLKLLIPGVPRNVLRRPADRVRRIHAVDDESLPLMTTVMPPRVSPEFPESHLKVLPPLWIVTVSTATSMSSLRMALSVAWSPI